MSLRYRLDKERFKGKKLPPKIRTNEDHISEDQRGDHSSLDDPYSEGGIKHALKQKLKQETDQMSRRGLFANLNQLKQYADEQEAREGPAAKPRKRKKVRKKRKAASGEAEAPVSSGAPAGDKAASTAPSGNLSEDTAPAPPEAAPAPKRGLFRRIKEHFFPTLDEDEAAPAPPAAREAIPEPAPDPKPEAPESSPESQDPIYGMAPTDVVEEARQHSAPSLEDLREAREEKELDRRNMIRQSIHFFARPAVEKIQTKIDKVNTVVDQVTKRPPLLRPPGAISERAFLQACTRCDRCVNACPKDAIRKVPKKMGWIIMDTPYIDPMKKPCVMCEDLPCISACQDEALLPVASKFEVRMGHVILDRKHCVAYGDGFCQQCVIECPIPGAITQKDQRPVFHRDVCTGCGACVRACATVNIPVALKVKPQMVIEAQRRKKEREQEEAELAARLEEERQRLEAEKAALEAEKAALAGDDPDSAEPEA